MTTLREYLITRLPRPVGIHQLTIFLGEPEVVDCMIQIEQLTERLIARWQQEPEVSSTNEASTDELTPVGEPVWQEPLSNDTIEPIDSFQAPEEEPTTEALLSQSEPDTNPVNDLRASSFAPEITPESMRLTPTTQSDSPAPQPLRAISIPNAMVGKMYRYTFDFGALGLPEVMEHSLLVNELTGLAYDSQSQTLTGKPITSGEFSFELTYKLRTEESARPTLSRYVNLLINPDPQSLWKDLPSDKSDPYYKPDSDRSLVAVEDIRMIAASVRGRSHAHEGKFRDDDFSLTHLQETEWYLLSVADGAGSARYARKGAQIACQTVTQYLQSAVEPQHWLDLDTAINQYVVSSKESMASVVQRQLYSVLGKAVFAAYKAIESEAQTKEAVLKDYSTTLITVLAKPLRSGWFVGAFWVGDGGVGIYQADDKPILLGTPDGGEFAGQTRFLTMSETISNNFFDRFRFAVVENFEAVLLMTDGITDPKFQTDNNLGRKEKWDELWADLSQSVSFADDEQAPAQLQDWLTFWSPGNHDDRTIALLYTHANNAKN